MVVEALRHAFAEFVRPLEQRQRFDAPQAVADGYRALYLSEAQVRNPGQGCPMPALGSEIAQASDPLTASTVLEACRPQDGGSQP